MGYCFVQSEHQRTTINQMKRLTLFAHYDGQSEVKDYVLEYLKCLRSVSDRVIFISTSALPVEQQARAGKFCDEVILKDNVGFDFSMWQLGIRQVALSDYDELLLTNSSIFGPLRPLEPYFEEMSQSPCDYWGMTESIQIANHIQSYFLVLKRPVLESDSFQSFFDAVLPFKDKSQTIRSYEVGLSVMLNEAGFVGAPYVEFQDLFPTGALGKLFKFKKRNPTCFYPLRLIEHGMPFVKVEVLRDNPAHVSLGPLKRLLQRAGYGEELIQFDRPVAARPAHKTGIYFRHIQRPLTQLLMPTTPDSHSTASPSE